MDSFPLGDIILLALVAGFIALRLRATLGKNSGLDPRQILRRQQEKLKETVIRVQNREAKPEAMAAVESDITLNEAAKRGLDAIRAADPSFSVSAFLQGARTAFEWVFEAFNKGDKEALKRLMSDSVFALFAQEIDRGRAAPERRPEATLIAVPAQDITDASLDGTTARVTVRFLSEQIHVVRGAGGAIIEGNPSDVQRVQDSWVFERDVASRGPNWKIVDT